MHLIFYSSLRPWICRQHRGEVFTLSTKRNFPTEVKYLIILFLQRTPWRGHMRITI